MKNIEAILLVVGLLFLYALILAFPTMVLWNWLIPKIFGLIQIDIFQAMGLNFLSGILLKSNVTVNKKD
jgi:hypothetical protein